MSENSILQNDNSNIWSQETPAVGFFFLLKEEMCHLMNLQENGRGWEVGVTNMLLVTSHNNKGKSMRQNVEMGTPAASFLPPCKLFACLGFTCDDLGQYSILILVSVTFCLGSMCGHALVLLLLLFN